MELEPSATDASDSRAEFEDHIRDLPEMRYFRSAFIDLPDLQHREDCFQEALLRAWQKFGQYQPDMGEFKYWFSTILRHIVVDFHRKAHGKTHVYSDVYDHRIFSSTSFDDRSDNAVTEELEELLNLLRPELGMQQNNVLTAWRYGEKVVDTANSLGLATATIRTYRSRIKQSAAACMRKNGIFES